MQGPGVASGAGGEDLGKGGWGGKGKAAFYTVGRVFHGSALVRGLGGGGFFLSLKGVGMESSGAEECCFGEEPGGLSQDGSLRGPPGEGSVQGL